MYSFLLVFLKYYFQLAAKKLIHCIFCVCNINGELIKIFIFTSNGVICLVKKQNQFELYTNFLPYHILDFLLVGFFFLQKVCEM